MNTGNNLLYLVLGLLLSLVILSGVLSEMALRGLEFRRKLPRRAYAGSSALIEIVSVAGSSCSTVRSGIWSGGKRVTSRGS